MMENSFEIKENMLEAMDDYHYKSYSMQKFYYDGNKENISLEQLKNNINDDLVFHVPVYDIRDRKYAAFSSLLEALINKDKDSKGNGKFFSHVNIESDFDFFMLFYLFRLCGSGINYNPIKSRNSINDILGTHGFGNFWIIDSLLEGKYTWKEWKQDLINLDKPFTNNKGYLLPQFSFPGISNGHLKKFILEYSEDLVLNIFNKVNNTKLDIYQVTDFGNNILKSLSFKKQNFVLSAFSMDIAEYYPKLVERNSKTYLGTSAQKCVKIMFNKVRKISDFEYQNDCMEFLAKRYNTVPYSIEDTFCDFNSRYIHEFQSTEHIKMNNGKSYKNNSILKKILGDKEYYNMINKLK